MFRSFAVLCLMFTSVFEQQSVLTGKDIASKIKVDFQLPASWASQQIVMDSIWRPLGLTGVNFYAFGAPADGHRFASRSDPKSPLYQAWIGTYAVAGGRERFSRGDARTNFGHAIQLAEFDQKAWLAGMGDPSPRAAFKLPYTTSNIEIAGARRVLFSFDMDSHSDIGDGTTDIAKELGMPPKSEWSMQLDAFHPLTLHVLYTFWYDQHKDITFVVYGVSCAYRDKSGAIHDNASLQEQLIRGMRSMRVTVLD